MMPFVGKPGRVLRDEFSSRSRVEVRSGNIFV